MWRQISDFLGAATKKKKSMELRENLPLREMRISGRLGAIQKGWEILEMAKGSADVKLSLQQLNFLLFLHLWNYRLLGYVS